MSKIAFIDIDGTILKGQSQQYFIKFLFEKKFISALDFVYIYGWFAAYRVGIARNAAGILNYALRKFIGTNSSQINNLMEEFYGKIIQPRLFRNSLALFETLKTAGYRAVLLSAAVEPIVKKISEKMTADEYICTELELDENGAYTGKLLENHLYGNEKSAKAQEYILQHALRQTEALAIADHPSDKSILEYASTSFVANPKEEMRKWALEKNIPVIYLDENESIQYIKSHIESK